MPDSEAGSLYLPGNLVGSPPGQTTSAASTPPAAIAGQEMPGSANFSFNLPVADLPGRGLDISLGLFYNSRLWNKSNQMTYDADGGWPAPGFRLGYGYLELKIQLASQGGSHYLLVDADGTRHKLAYVSSTDKYVTTDGTFVTFDADTQTTTYSDGTRVIYGAADGNTISRKRYPTKITDRNGNYLEITYKDGVGPRLYSVKDTLGRLVLFHYDSNNDLVTVTVPGYGSTANPPDRQTIRFYYETIQINPAGSFSVTTNGVTSARVIRYVYFPGTQAGYRYDYSQPYGMIYRITQFRGMQVSSTALNATGTVTSDGQQAAVTEYNYPTAPTNLVDAPAYTTRTDDWAGRTTGEAAPFYTFSVDAAQGLSTVTAPDGTITETRTIVNPGGWDDGLVKETLVKKDGVVLAKINTDWEHWELGEYNQRVKEIRTTNENNQTKETVYTYYPASATSFNNVWKITEYGYQNEELRRTEMEYETREAYETQGLLHLPTSVSVYPGGSTTATSRVEYVYDEGSLTSYSDIQMLDSSYGTITARGNVTTVKNYANAGTLSDPIVNTTTYDVAGNVLTQTMDCCRQKKFIYDSAYQYAYATEVDRGDVGQMKSYLSYDRNTGLVKTATDENGLATTFDYFPDSLRHKETIRPDGGYTRNEYMDGLTADPDAAHMHSYVKTTTAFESGREAISWQYADGRGAPVRALASTPDGYIMTDIEYDKMGRVYRNNNPYYNASGPTGAINQAGWTTRIYDGLGRVKTITTPDSNTISFSYGGSVSFSYAGVTVIGSAVTVTDQAGKQRRQIVDALGRLRRVDEPDLTGDLGTLSAPKQATFYEYDALDNLTHVEQGAQHRYFKYDSLGQLIRQKQAEAVAVFDDAGQYVGAGGAGAQWSDVFVYNNRRQLVDAYDARNVHTHYVYTDGLNRLTEITYSDGTPKVTYSYDQPPSSTDYFNAGRLTEVATWVGTTKQTAQAYEYDKMGRVSLHKQTIGADTYTLTYGYNLAGELAREVYPSGRVVTNEYDAAARLSKVKVEGADGRAYSSEMKYGAHGGLTSQTLGNGVVQAVDYNNRLQVKEISLTKQSNALARYVYKYGEVNQATGAVDTMKNTGQVALVEGTIGSELQWQQRMSYDSLGRLKQAAEYRGDDLNNRSYLLAYEYDKYGNRYQQASQQITPPTTVVPVTSTDISSQANRFTNNVEYDDAGNVRVDQKFRGMQYEYDANGRMKRALNVGGGGEILSVYDGLGQRVQSTSSGETTNLVYDAFGQLVAEYGVTSVTGSGGVRYLASDNQGSTRVVMDNAGTVISRRDYQPFGEEIPGSVGKRTNISEYGASLNARQQYAGTESEPSGLNHSSWRAQESRAGRWTSPDPYDGSMRPANPQSMNRYSYVSNDPMNRIDPSGLDDTPSIGSFSAGNIFAGYVNDFADFANYAVGGGLNLNSLKPLISQQTGKQQTISKLKDSIYNDKALMAKINACIVKVFGLLNSWIIGQQTQANSPDVNVTLKSAQIQQKFNMSSTPYAAGVGNVGGQYGTIFIGSEWFNTSSQWTVNPPGQNMPGRTPLQNAYVHELGNLFSYRLTGGSSYIRFGIPEIPGVRVITGGWDNDSGWQFQLCVYGN
ncbi:MAG TPA: RHS repeat-associated core domain-containing protein [Pyrinomonadaceae bacterium]